MKDVISGILAGLLIWVGWILIFLPSDLGSPDPNPDPSPEPDPIHDFEDGDLLDRGLELFRDSYATLVLNSEDQDPAQFHEAYVLLLDKTFAPLGERFSALRVDEDQDGEPDGDLEAYAHQIREGRLQ